MSELKQREPYETKLMFKQRQISHLVVENKTLKEALRLACVDKQFNINDSVFIKLTKEGKKVCALEEYEGFVENGDGVSEWQLWTLMSIFGKHMNWSSTAFFENNNIVFKLGEAAHFLTQATPEGG